VPRKPRLVGGVKGHNQNEISLAHILFATACPGSPALWAGSFNIPPFVKGRTGENSEGAVFDGKI
jgi:hypothetical protein